MYIVGYKSTNPVYFITYNNYLLMNNGIYKCID